MSFTALQILNQAAYRLGENSNPDDSNEQVKRLAFLNTAYRQIVQLSYWWWLEDVYSFQTVDGKSIYDLPSDYRELIDLRIDKKKVYPKATDGALSTWDKPVNSGSTADNYYFIYNNQLNLIPEASETPTTHSVSSITVSGTVATVTTATAHGLEADDYVVIAGADVEAYNTSFRVQSVPSTTTYTITIASGTAEPTGTITSTENNITMKYYKNPATLTATSDVVLVPEIYIDALSAYVFARVQQINDERGDASDGFAEYKEVLKQMIRESNRRNVWGKSVNPDNYENEAIF